MDEECELRDLVAKTLENNGTLAKLRAQLRASVFLALEEQDFCKAFVNKPLQEFVRTTEGALITSLVREFLECFGLDVTLSVFDPETGLGKDYDVNGRKTLIQQLNLNVCNDAGTQKPLIAHLLKLDKTICKSHGVPQKEELNVTFEKKSSVADTNKTFEAIANSGESDKACKDEKTVGKQPETVPSWMQEDRTTFSQGVLSNITKQKLDANKLDANKQPLTMASATFLSNLPPLLGTNSSQLQQPSHLSGLNTDSDLELKAMLDMGLDYEEDFNSSGSGQEKSPKSIPATESEIEEEIEDIDEVSNISAGEDFTADKSLS